MERPSPRSHGGLAASWLWLLAMCTHACGEDEIAEPRTAPTFYLVALPDSSTVLVRGSTLRCLSPDGRPRWTTHLEGGPIVLPPTAAPDSRIYARSRRALHSVGPDGAVQWSVPLDPPLTFAQEASAPVAMADSSVVVVEHPTRIRAFDREGQSLWTVHVPAELIIARPVVTANGNVLAQVSSRVFCYSPTGSLLWDRALTANVPTGASQHRD